MLLFIRKWVYDNIPQEWQEAILEGLRLALFTGIGFLVDYLISFFTTIPQETVVILILFLLRIVDKKVHEAQQEKFRSPDKMVGISGF